MTQTEATTTKVITFFHSLFYALKLSTCENMQISGFWKHLKHIFLIFREPKLSHFYIIMFLTLLPRLGYQFYCNLLDFTLFILQVKDTTRKHDQRLNVKAGN